MAANTPTDPQRMVVSTMFDVNHIEQMVDFGGIEGPLTERVAKHVLDLREEGVRRALLKLGWLPPETTNEVKRLLRNVEKVAGNQTDDALDTRTGPNDAALRGCFVIAARTYAGYALQLLGEEPANFKYDSGEQGDGKV